MKEISITLWELTKDEVNRLPDGTTVLIYNSLTLDYKLEYSGKNCISRSKYAFSSLKYFTFEAPKLLTTVYYVMGNDIGDEPYCFGGEVKCGPFLDLDKARDQEYKMSEELTLAGQHIYYGLYIDSEEIYV